MGSSEPASPPRPSRRQRCDWARGLARAAGAPDLWLLFAPLKKARTDFVVEKATELGASEILPVLTERTDADTVRTDRLQRIAIEAAEQTERLDVPPFTRRRSCRRCSALEAGTIADLCRRSRGRRGKALGRRGWPGASGIASGLGALKGPAAILIGPEGRILARRSASACGSFPMWAGQPGAAHSQSGNRCRCGACPVPGAGGRLAALGARRR